VSALAAGKAHALTITSATCTNPAAGENQLRVNCQVYTDALAEVWVEFDDEGDGACSAGPARESSHSYATAGGGFGGGGGGASPGTPVMYYMKAETPYCWRPWAKPVTGSGPPVHGGWRTVSSGGAVTTGGLPLEVATISWNIDGLPQNVENVAFNYACRMSGTRDYDWIVIADTEGTVMWYEDPSGVTGGRSVAITGLAVAEDEGTILAILDHDYVVEYAGSGEVQRLYCRDDDGGEDSCVDDGVVADAYTSLYFHHDVMRTDDRTLVLAAHQSFFAFDYQDCDDDDDTTDFTYVVAEGVLAYRTADDGFDELWQLSDDYDTWDSYLDEQCAKANYDRDPETPDTCGNSYWGDEIEGCDWAHINSTWEDDDGDWLISQKAWSRVVNLEDVGSSHQLAWTLSGGPYDAGDFDLSAASGAGDAAFYEQHAARWQGPDSMLIYDNDSNADYGAPHRSRGIDVELNPTTWEALVVEQYVMKTEAGGAGSTFVKCDTGGSVTHVPPPGAGEDSVLAFCVGRDTDGPSGTEDEADDPLFNEFELDGTLRWSMEATCESESEDTRSRPSYRGYANVLLE
jgi:hypothetical protein